ncbi:hypothetical protein VSQ48_05920 [Candidatus Ventrimonas sp. KK005]
MGQHQHPRGCGHRYTGACKGSMADLAPDRGVLPLGAVGYYGAFTAPYATGETPQDA